MQARHPHRTRAGLLARITFCTGLALGCVVALATAAQAQATKAEDIIRTHSCPGCHVIPGIPEAVGKIGPSLLGLGDRPRIASGSLSNTEKNLRRWLRNPKNVKDTMMPNTGLTEAEIDVLIPFLEKL